MLTDKSKPVLLCCALVASSISAIGITVAQAETTGQSNSNLVKEISVPRPIYPTGGWKKSVDGHVTLTFDVSEHGRVQNPCFVASSVPGFFELYALQAAKASKYEHTSDPPQHVLGIKKDFYFTLDSNPNVRIRPKYPRQGLEYGYQGFVIVDFRVTSKGTVSNEKVVGAEPGVIFNKAALDAARKFKFDAQRFARNDRVHHKFIFSLDSEPTNLVIPDYPTLAKDNKIEGHVVVKFDINNKGLVENAEAIYTNSRELTASAVSAVEQFTFKPDKPANGMLHRVDFILDLDYTPMNKATPEYPKQAMLDNIEGYVIVRYDIDEKGSAVNPSVVTAKPPDIFNQSALASVATFKYRPRYIDGIPTVVSGAMSKILFTLSNDRGASPRRTQEGKRSIRLTPSYELNLNGNLEDGSVIVEFDVNKEGYVEQPRIVEVVDSNLTKEITDQILDEVSYFWYWPLYVFNNPIRVRDVRHRIELRFHEN